MPEVQTPTRLYDGTDLLKNVDPKLLYTEVADLVTYLEADPNILKYTADRIQTVLNTQTEETKEEERKIDEERWDLTDHQNMEVLLKQRVRFQKWAEAVAKNIWGIEKDWTDPKNRALLQNLALITLFADSISPRQGLQISVIENGEFLTQIDIWNEYKNRGYRFKYIPGKDRSNNGIFLSVRY